MDAFAFLKNLSNDANFLIGLLQPVAKKDAETILPTILATELKFWTIRDREQYSKGFFSNTQMPTKRTLSAEFVVTPYFEKLKRERPEYIEEITYEINYSRYLTTELRKLMNKKEDELELGIVFHKSNTSMVLQVKYTYDVV